MAVAFWSGIIAMHTHRHKIMIKGTGKKPWVLKWKSFIQKFFVCSLCAITGVATAFYYLARCKGAHKNCRIDLHMDQHKLSPGYFLGLLATGVLPLGLAVDLTLHHRMFDDSEEESVPLTPVVPRMGGFSDARVASTADEDGGGGVTAMAQL